MSASQDCYIGLSEIGMAGAVGNIVNSSQFLVYIDSDLVGYKSTHSIFVTDSQTITVQLQYNTTRC